MYLVCPECLLASLSIRKRTGFNCPHCKHEWESPRGDYSGAYFFDLNLLESSLVAPDGERFVLASFPTVLGRDSDFKKLQENRAVSREHFEVGLSDGKIIVSDLDSRGGTFLGENQLTPGKPVPFNPGDSLRVSGVELKLEIRFTPAAGVQTGQEQGPAVVGLDSSEHELVTIGGMSSEASFHVPLAVGNEVYACFFTAKKGETWKVLAITPGAVLVNGEKVIERTLKSNDEISIGQFQYAYLPSDHCLRPLQSEESAGVGLSRICYSVSSHGSQKKIINDISLNIPAGKLTAIIGPSGSGKTTIMKVLAGVLKPDSGELLMDGQKMGFAQYQERMRGKIGLVPQEDIVHQEITIKQSMEYAASLRLSRQKKRAEKIERIERILKDLDLWEHRFKQINQLSGGQRKRVNVAVELISSPSLLLLDEPNTGLDTVSEKQLSNCLKRLARQGRTVAFITHSLSILEQSDHVIFVQDDGGGGRILAQGSPNVLKNKHQIEDWGELFIHDDHKQKEVPATPDVIGDSLSKHAVSMPRIGSLCLRYLNIWLASRWASFFSLLVLPLLLGALIRLALPNDGPAGKDRFLFGVICAFWLGMNQTVREVIKERSLMLRERLVGVKSSSYLLSKLSFFLIAGPLQALALVAPMVWLEVSGLNVRIAPCDLHCPVTLFWLVLLLGFIVGACVGLLISTACLFIRAKGEIVAVLMVVLMTLPQILFSEKVLGGFVDKPSDYHSFVLTETGSKIAESASYLTVSRYLYLPLVARNNQISGHDKAFRHNIMIIISFAVVCLVIAWIIMEIFIHRRQRQLNWN